MVRVTTQTMLKWKLKMWTKTLRVHKESTIADCLMICITEHTISPFFSSNTRLWVPWWTPTPSVYQQQSAFENALSSACLEPQLFPSSLCTVELLIPLAASSAASRKRSKQSRCASLEMVLNSDNIFSHVMLQASQRQNLPAFLLG